MTALLVSTDTQLISEFEAIAAFADTNLKVVNQLTPDLIPDTRSIFVDHQIREGNLELLAGLQIANPGASVTLVLTGAPNQDTWLLASQIKAEHIALIPESKPWLLEFLKTKPSRSAQTFTFYSTVGGLGISTLALTAAKQLSAPDCRVLVVDLDFLSIGLPIAAGAENIRGLTWESLIFDAADADPEAIWTALPTKNGIKLLAHETANFEIGPQQLCRALVNLQSVADVIILDAGRWGQSSAALSDLPSSEFIISGNTVRSCAVAQEIFRQPRASNLQLLVRELPGSSLSPMSIANSIQQPLVKVLPTDNRILELSEQGQILAPNSMTKFGRAVAQFCRERLLDEQQYEAA
ncbi:MAG: hypothetical protein KGQ38_07635 [Actinomycetales bacterium]|nr:hypothetical protein [Actinomycetales bacterium]